MYLSRSGLDCSCQKPKAWPINNVSDIRVTIEIIDTMIIVAIMMKIIKMMLMIIIVMVMMMVIISKLNFFQLFFSDV